MKKIILITVLILISIIVYLFVPFRTYNGSNLNGNLFSLNEGKRLAGEVCTTCHILPEASLLPQEGWKFILPYMGLYLGIKDSSLLRDDILMKNQLSNRAEMLKFINRVPKKALLNKEQWKLLKNYYLYNATVFNKTLKKKNIAFTNLFTPDYRFKKAKDKAITMVNFNKKAKELLFGYAWQNKIARFDFSGKPLGFISIKSAPVLFYEDDNNSFVTFIGDLMGSHPGEKLGRIEKFTYANGNWKSKVLIKNLYRTAHSSYHDFNKDGKPDIVVSGFGILGDGAVSLFLSQADNSYKEIVLFKDSGAVKTIIEDMNNDGKKDIMLLMSDAREGVYIFYQKENFTFDTKQIIVSPPSMGYTTFEYEDFNNDGHKDILLVNGDNLDSGPYNLIKPYHGVKIYYNDGKNNFKLGKSFFMPGAYFAKVVDFNKDGNLDIAVVSHFADLRDPVDFLYIENKGNNIFKSYQIKNLPQLRYTVMDTGDIDNDGDIDIIMAASAFPYLQKVKGKIQKRLFKSNDNVIVLKNNLYK